MRTVPMNCRAVAQVESKISEGHIQEAFVTFDQLFVGRESERDSTLRHLHELAASSLLHDLKFSRAVDHLKKSKCDPREVSTTTFPPHVYSHTRTHTQKKTQLNHYHYHHL